MDFEVRVDPKVCIGSGQCVHVAGGAFEQGDDAIAYVARPSGEPVERLVHAVRACPMQAITVHLGGATVGADTMKDWVAGGHSGHPLLALLERAGEDHHELGEALADGLPDRVAAAVRTYLEHAEEIYRAFRGLVDDGLLDVLEADRAALAARADTGAAGAARHAELAEAVLFPVLLSALAKRS